MNKLFLNSRFLHFFYGSLVLLLSVYLYASIVPKESYEALSEVIKNNILIIDNSSAGMMSAIQEETKAYQNTKNLQVLATAHQIVDLTNESNEKWNDIIKSFKKYLSEQPDFLKQTSIPTRMFFSEKMLHEYQENLRKYYQNTIDTLLDTSDKKLIINTLDSIRVNQFDCNFRETPANMALLTLQRISMQQQIWENTLLAFIRSRYASCEMKFDKFAVGIFPNSEQIKVGEPFEASLSAINYASAFDVNHQVTFYVNNKEIKDVAGVAHFEIPCTKVGKQFIIAQVVLKNLLTGQTETSKREYGFEVLPKYKK